MYDIVIQNRNQPMLITKAKKKDICNKAVQQVCCDTFIITIIKNENNCMTNVI